MGSHLLVQEATCSDAMLNPEWICYIGQGGGKSRVCDAPVPGGGICGGCDENGQCKKVPYCSAKQINVYCPKHWMWQLQCEHSQHCECQRCMQYAVELRLTRLTGGAQASGEVQDNRAQGQLAEGMEALRRIALFVKNGPWMQEHISAAGHAQTLLKNLWNDMVPRIMREKCSATLPRLSLHVFGSEAYSVQLPSSDVDVVGIISNVGTANLEKEEAFLSFQRTLLHILFFWLHTENGVSNVSEHIDWKSTVVYRIHGVKVDLSLSDHASEHRGHSLSVYVAECLDELSSQCVCPRVHEACRVLVEWAKEQGICADGNVSRTISKYGALKTIHWVLLCILALSKHIGNVQEAVPDDLCRAASKMAEGINSMPLESHLIDIDVRCTSHKFRFPMLCERDQRYSSDPIAIMVSGYQSWPIKNVATGVKQGFVTHMQLLLRSVIDC